MTLRWEALDKKQTERKIKELTRRCVKEERLFISIIGNSPIPTIELGARFFNEVYSAGEVRNTSRIKVHILASHFFPELLIWWKTIGKKVNLTFNGWRDWEWLTLLCKTKKIVLISREFCGKAIVVDNLVTDVLLESLVMASMFPVPKEYSPEE